MHNCQLTEKLVEDLSDNHAHVEAAYPKDNMNVDNAIILCATVFIIFGLVMLIR